MNIFGKNIDLEKYIIVEYFIKSRTSLKTAAWNLAIGQSVGNPNVRSAYETEELFRNHSCMILADESDLEEIKEGYVKIGFPLANLDIKHDGISQLLCQIMGGQLDIDDFEVCHITNMDFPQKFKDEFKGPKFGITGIREFTGAEGKPILGGIVKPKVSPSVDLLLNMVKEMVEGGVNFIKEDEIMSNPSSCPIEERVPIIMEYLKDKNVIYSVCINSDPPYLLDRVKRVYELGGNSVHVNFWSGIGSYKAIRDLDLPIFLLFQKSGDKILTDSSHRFHIDWNVMCKLAGLMGVDFIHAGMWGGYSSYGVEELHTILDTLHEYNVMPSLSCGMHPGLIDAINHKFGIDYMANTGGAIHGHPMGSKSGAMAMRQSIDKDYKEEYKIAIEKWGKI